MPKQIWKYKLDTAGIQVTEMQKGAEILSVQEQANSVCIWALVKPEAKKELRTFHIYGTGHPVGDDLNLKYIGSCQLNNGLYVFHLFEEIK